MSLNEDQLCRVFAEKIRDSTDFLVWVLAQTKFREQQSTVRLLYDEQVRIRPSVSPENWWRHWWRKIPSTGREGETDILLVFEDKQTKKRFALHIENKKNTEFLDGQAEGYEIRARLQMNNARWLNYADFATVLIAPTAYRPLRRTTCDMFDCFISYETIASFVPEFGLQTNAKTTASSVELRPIEKCRETGETESSPIAWKQDVDWHRAVEQILRYYRLRRDLTIASRRAFSVIDLLCSRSSVTQEELMRSFSLTRDNIQTILANVTMAIQRKGSVWSPASGGWYTTTTKPHTYIVCPGFRAVWEAKRQ